MLFPGIFIFTVGILFWPNLTQKQLKIGKRSKLMLNRPKTHDKELAIVGQMSIFRIFFLLCFIQIIMSNSWCSGRFLWHNFEDLVFFIECFVVWCLCWRFLRFFHRILNMNIVFSWLMIFYRSFWRWFLPDRFLIS